MSTAQKIRNHAAVFGWERHSDPGRRQDTFIHGPHMIAVDYRRDESVDRAARFYFVKITDPQLRETTGSRDKGSAVVGWLVGLGS